MMPIALSKLVFVVLHDQLKSNFPKRKLSTYFKVKPTAVSRQKLSQVI